MLCCCLLVALQASFRELWAPLLSLAELWSRAREAPLSAAAAQLYCDLFVVFESSLERQQVLQALHSHLGSGVAAEQDVALQVSTAGGTVDSLLLGVPSRHFQLGRCPACWFGASAQLLAG